MDKREFEERIRHVPGDLNTGHLPMATRTRLVQYGVYLLRSLGLADIHRAGMNALMAMRKMSCDVLAVWSDKSALIEDREVSELEKVLREFVTSGYRFRRATFPLEGSLRKLSYTEAAGESKAAYG